MRARTYSVDAPVDTLRISVYGSSVANGQGADEMKGYAYRYGELLKQRYASGASPYALYTSGVSIGGNTTRDLLARYDDLLNDFSRYVVIGLSLGNEGIHEADDKEAVFARFRDNMLTLIEKIRADGKVPVVVNNYTRADYNDADYSYIRRINMLIHEWDVPSVNTLGAIDDGAGHWAEGFMADGGHPNTDGHREFMHSFVPSLFDALVAGKPLPRRDTSKHIRLDKGRTLELVPEDSLRAFTVCVRVKGKKAGRLLAFDGGDVTVDADGTLVYTSPQGETIRSAATPLKDGRWHDVALTHYYARGYTALYVDGDEIGSVGGRIEPGRFVFGDDANVAASRDFSEISLWRAGMNADEMKAHHEGQMLKSSLEIYSPMQYDADGIIPNHAQSTNSLIRKR